MTDRILSLDISITTGWASDMPSGGPVPCFGHFTIEPDKGEALGRAAYQFRKELHALILVHKPTVLVYEAPLGQQAHGFNFAELVLGLCCLVRLAAFENGIEEWACEIGTVRAHFINDGRARKDAKQKVWDRCKLLGWNPPTLDCSDAAACWSYAHHTLRQGEIEAKAARQWA